ncbi:Lipopolysaccharide-binding protein-like [Oopsacas minuta]|uniref:Lipopolysaccharide-binding protein-like n=1 Tax=Oopsacas minuta TaxID=111878 RepID=A0AAV7K0E2_9METZ|nr:Lipopolysaccharide-binding protein-like [Oopsacas minuta]
MFYSHFIYTCIKINLILGFIILSVFGFLILIPNFRGVVRNAIYEAIITYGTPILSSYLNKIDIPDQVGSVSTMFGTINYGVTNIGLNEVEIQHSYANVDKDGVTLSFCNVSIGGHIDWSFKLSNPPVGNITILEAKGTADAKFSQVKLVSGFNLVSNNGTLALSYHHCKFVIDKVDLEFHKSSLSPILNIFRHFIADILEDFVNNHTCIQIRAAITKKANSKLRTIPIGIDIAEAVKIFIKLFSDTEVGEPPETCKIPHPHSNRRSQLGCKAPPKTLTPTEAPECKDEEESGCSRQKNILPHIYF